MTVNANLNPGARKVLGNLLDGKKNKPRRRRGVPGAALGVLVMLLVFGTGIGYQIALHHHNVTHTNCVVTGKDRGIHYDATRKHLHNEMRVYTSNCGTFKVTDIRLRGRFDSADVYGKLEVGKTYDITAMGYRIPLFSQFPDITSVTVK